MDCACVLCCYTIQYITIQLKFCNVFLTNIRSSHWSLADSNSCEQFGRGECSVVSPRQDFMIGELQTLGPSIIKDFHGSIMQSPWLDPHPDSDLLPKTDQTTWILRTWFRIAPTLTQVSLWMVTNLHLQLTNCTLSANSVQPMRRKTLQIVLYSVAHPKSNLTLTMLYKLS